MKVGQLEVDGNAVAEICRKWKISKLEAFGSVLRDDFDAESDVDLLVTFIEGANPGYFELFDAQEQFSSLFGRRVELVPKTNLKWVIRDRVISEARPVYSA